MSYEELQQTAAALRDSLKIDETAIRKIIATPIPFSDQAFEGQADEMMEQATLALRHIEDARMRLGKFLQYAGTGVSKFDIETQ